MGQVQRFHASVAPVRRAKGWGVRIEISAPEGTLMERVDVNQFVFDTRDVAADAGWRIAESLIRKRLTPVDRASSAA